LEVLLVLKAIKGLDAMIEQPYLFYEDFINV